MKFLRKYYRYLLLFLFFFIIACFMPLSGDDWHNYTVGNLGLHRIIGQTLGMYFDWEGRLASRILINLLTYHKLLFNLLEAFFISGCIYLMNNLFKPKNEKLFFLLTVWLFLLLENKIFTQTILWVAGSITYLFPTLLIFSYLFLYYHYILEKTTYPKIIYIVFSLASLALAMFVENIAFAFVLLNFLLIINYYFQKKLVNKLLVVNSCFSLLGALIMFFSPGSNKRMLMEDVAFSKLSFLSKLATNYHKFINYTISSNIFLVIIMSSVGIILSHKYIKNIFLKIIAILSISVYPLISIIFTLQSKSLSLFSNLYWSFYLIYILILSFIYLKEKKKQYYFFILVIPALASNIIMLLTPAISSRTGLFNIIFLGYYFIFLLDNLVSSKVLKAFYKPACFVTILLGLIYLVAYYNLHRFTLFQEKEILKHQKDKQVTIYEVPEYLAWGLTPRGEYHVKTFKEYYNLPEDIVFNYQKSTWDYLVIFNAKKTRS